MADKIDKPGIYKMSSEVYHADPCVVPSLSRGTIADLINCTPAHARFYHPRLNPDYVPDEKTAYDIGTAAHSLILEGINCCEVVDAQDWRSKDAKTARDEARLAGKTPLLKHQYKDVLAMVNSFRTQLATSELGVKDLQEEGTSESTYIWNEGDTWFRIRPDWISSKNIGDRKLILDYKSCGDSASPDSFLRKALSFGYIIQEHLYKRGVKANEGGNLPRFCFILQETFAPFLCSFVMLDPALQEIGKQQTEYGIFMWEKCMSTGEWPGYPQRICHLDCPPWVLAQWEQKAASIGEE